MIHSSRFAALLDANLLYSAPVRDYLFHLASLDLYKPKWTLAIQEEWVRNLLQKRPDISQEQLKKTSDAMISAFPDAIIEDYEGFIEGLTLPDLDDRHVLAAAIIGQTDVLVTFNLKDFPEKELKKYHLEVQHPDDFVLDLIALDEAKALKALKNQTANLKNPPKTIDEVLETLRNCGLVKSVAKLSELRQKKV